MIIESHAHYSHKRYDGTFRYLTGQLTAEEGSRTGWKNCSAIGYTITLSVRLRQRSQVVNWYSTNLQYRNAGAF